MRGVWPVYFAAVDIEGRNFRCKKGDLLPFADPGVLRGMGPALGVPDAARRPLGKLPYIKVLNVGSVEMERHLQTIGASYEKARKLCEEAA